MDRPISSNQACRSAGRQPIRTALLAVVFLAVAAPALATTLNMSRDLVARGIAAQNMTPNSPWLDARPLFQAALDYVRNNAITTVTVDPGAYYFLTSQYPNDYLVISVLSNVTIDLAGSTIYLKDPWAAGIMLWYCHHLTFTNFKIDYINPPYTHVRLTSVDTANRVLRYAPMDGWPQDPSIFGAYATASELSSVVAVAFRNGRIVPGTSRMPLQGPVGGGSLPLFQNFAPWTQAATLSTLQPGDTIVVTFRGGAAGPLKCWHCDAVTLSHFTIHGANNWAVEVTHASNTVVDHARVEPRAGALIGSSADGIHFHNSRRNNHIRNSYVTATVDDALIMQSLAVATVTAQNGPQLTVTRTGFDRFPNGTAVNFVDTSTGAEVTGAAIVAQNPADSQQPGFGETVTLTLSRALPEITPGMRMVFADATMRGSGSTIEDNVVENILMGRGVWIGGSRGTTIQRNVIRTTSSAAISLFEDTINFVGPPAHDIVIQDNRLESNLGPMASGSLTQFAMAAVVINTVVTDNFRFGSWAVNSNISVIDNVIVDSGRGGIWMGETNGGTIANNRIVSWRQHPELPIFAVPADLQPQVLDDITQPIVVRYNASVSVQNNTLGCATFTDDPLVAGATAVKAAHLVELRTCIDALRLHYGLSPYPYMDPTVTSAATAIKAQHLADLRTALSQAYAAAKMSPPSFTDSIVSGQTAVRAVHFSELRAAIQTLDSVLH